MTISALIACAPLFAAQAQTADALTEKIIEERKAAARQALAREREARDDQTLGETPAFPDFPSAQGFPKAPWENDRPPRAQDLAKGDPSVDWLRLLLTPLRASGEAEDEPTHKAPERPTLSGPRVAAPSAPSAPKSPASLARPIKPTTPDEIEARKAQDDG